MKKKVKKIIPEAFIIEETLKKEQKKHRSDELVAPPLTNDPFVNLPKKEEQASVIIIDF